MSLIDDPRLTAFALGEMNEVERAKFSVEIANDPGAQQAVIATRELASNLSAALAAEPSPALAPLRLVTNPWRNYRIAAAVAATLLIATGGVLIVLPSFRKARLAAAETSASSVPSATPQKLTTIPSDLKQVVAPPPPLSVLAPQPTVMVDALSKVAVVGEAHGVNASGGGAGPVAYHIGGTVVNGTGVSGGAYNVVGKTGRAASALNNFADAAEPEPRPSRFNTESYDRVVDNEFRNVAHNPLSTVSVDVDTASYCNMRRFLNNGQLPPKDAIRIEEMINYFPYAYPFEEHGAPISSGVEVAQCPWNPSHRLARIAIKAREVAQDKRPPSNLVFLIDVSGSMNEPNKLPLVKQSIEMLAQKLGENDRIALVVYAGNAGLVLPSTRATHHEEIVAAIERLQAGGSTNGAEGIALAYSIAQENFIKAGTNRVILCTDGDWNVGVTNQGDLTRMIEEKAKGGVFLTVLGFGMDNLKDSTMEKLADKGNGYYGYIDTAAEAKKLFVDELSSTLVTVAKDVKIQVEFNPAKVSSYRLIGYEDRLLAKEDFNNDKKDAGDMGAGHTVTAFYELMPITEKLATPEVDPLKYQTPPTAAAVHSDELLTLKIRFKEPDAETSKLLQHPATDAGKSFADASPDFQFAASVAEFGMVLRDSPFKGNANFASALETAQSSKGEDPAGYRGEFINLVETAEKLAKK